MNGKVYLIGCGIRKGHLTLDGLRALNESDVVLYDRLVDEDTVKGFKGRKIYVGKKPGESHIQERTNKLLYDYAKRGKTVARLKAGDSFLFSRGFEEYDYLRKRGVCVEVLPGLSAFQALAEFGIPLTYRDGSSSVAFITGAKAKPSRSYTGLCADTLVFYMPVGNLKRIVSLVKKQKKNASCTIVENIGRKNYRVVSGCLDDIVTLAEEAEVTPPALFVVSSHRRRLYENKILTFRQKDREQETIRKLKGFDVMNYPLYDVNYRKIKKIRAGIFAFTSPNAVESVFSQHRFSGKFVAIGERTAETLRKYGVRVRIPRIQSSTGLMNYLSKYDKKDVVIFCSSRTNVKGYRKAYAYDVTYKKKAPGLRKRIKETEVVFITSSEILNTLCNLVPVKLVNAKTIVVIGPKTAVTAKKHGVHVDFMLEKPLIEELDRIQNG